MSEPLLSNSESARFASTVASDPSVLSLRNVSKTYRVNKSLVGKKKFLWALKEVSLDIHAGEIIAVVGESGCGKSTLGRIIAGAFPATSGEILLQGQSLAHMGRAEFRREMRGIQLVHQDPYSALHPTKTVEAILHDPLRIHRMVDKNKISSRLRELLELVGLSPVENFLQKYPYQLSGGQRQRVVLARALTVNPRLIVADEAVSMIDVSMRQTILSLMKRLQKELGIAYVFITHDLALARYFAQGYRTIVMYAGQVIEQGPTEAVITDPRHPYSAILKAAVPRANPEEGLFTGLRPRTTDLPDLTNTVPGCRFAPRCPFVQDQCTHRAPELSHYANLHRDVACHRTPEWPAIAAASGESHA